VLVIFLLLIVGGGLSGLAALQKSGGKQAVNAGGDTDGVITDDVYFYGLSPPVYPSRKFNALSLRDFLETVE